MDQLGIGDLLAAAAAGRAARGERVAAPMIDQTNRRQVLALRELGQHLNHAGRRSIRQRLLAREAVWPGGLEQWPAGRRSWAQAN
jgi:hypothetical protein